jgi:uncharacterized repeat protein (TIGR04076 family)
MAEVRGSGGADDLAPPGDLAPPADDLAPPGDLAPPADSASLYDLRVVVDRIEGRSVCGLQVGDWFELTQSSRLRTCPGRFFCAYALAAVLPLLPAKQRQLERTGTRTIPLAGAT